MKQISEPPPAPNELRYVACTEPAIRAAVPSMSPLSIAHDRGRKGPPNRSETKYSSARHRAD